jgi:hypothetical protein
MILTTWFSQAVDVCKFKLRQIYKIRFSFFLPFHPHLTSKFVKSANMIQKSEIEIEFLTFITCWQEFSAYIFFWVKFLHFFNGLEPSIKFCVL